MTPDELRELLIPNTAITSDEVRRRISAAADAWDLALVARYAIEEKYRALVKRLEEAERAIYDGRLYSAHFKAWADQIEIDQGYAGSEVACLLRRLAALAKEEKT